MKEETDKEGKPQWKQKEEKGRESKRKWRHEKSRKNTH